MYVPHHVSHTVSDVLAATSLAARAAGILFVWTFALVVGPLVFIAGLYITLEAVQH